MALLRWQNEANCLTSQPTKQSLKHQPSSNPQSKLPLPRERFSPWVKMRPIRFLCDEQIKSSRQRSKQTFWQIGACLAAVALSACGGPHGRNVYGYPEDDRLISRCSTGDGVTIALYINTAGGAAVGTSFSVTAEHKPDLAERQIMYSEIPALTAITCEPNGFELATSGGRMTFNDSELSALRSKPQDLDAPVRKAAVGE